MTPEEFIKKWKAAELKERSAAQEHFLDLCELLNEPKPAAADPKGEWFCFERGATKTTGGEGWADVWKRGHFGWEYKGKRKDLTAAFAQLQQYAIALENPPLLVVCGLDRFEIHTNWTNSVSKVYTLDLDDLRDASNRDRLKAVFSDPERLRPGKTRQVLTEEAAGEFAVLAKQLRERGHDPQKVAHFINRLIFCMFAEDIDLLPNKMFSRLLEHAKGDPGRFEANASQLFAAMGNKGGAVGFEAVEWFNGGLFDDDSALPLTADEIELTKRAADLDWAEIDPSIFGTLFERGLDPDKRSQLGAHYTDRDKIMMIVEPVIVRPWLADWATTKAEIEIQLAKAEEARQRTPKTQKEAKKVYAAARRAESVAIKKAQELLTGFLERLRAFTVLDPACGSGNFLYLALRALKDLELRIGIEAETLGFGRPAIQIGPECVKGIELNPYAAELARVTVWIGEIQWMRRNGFNASKNPILKPLNNIECRDALLNPDGSEAEWPEADVIIGNPPFLGGKLMRSSLGDALVDQLFSQYRDRVRPEADLVTYWFAKSWEGMKAGKHNRVGLVATNSIRGGANREVLKPVVAEGSIFEAWDDEPWVVDGAAVRVAIVCFEASGEEPVRLDGQPAARIHSDLTSGDIDLTAAARLEENGGVAFMGDTKGGAFDIAADQARAFLSSPLNPNGRPNSDVLRPWVNGMDITRRPAGKWIIDFGWTMSESDAQLYEGPFEYAAREIRPVRKARQERGYAKSWWRHERPRPDMWAVLSSFDRYIVTPRVSKFRVFVWLSTIVVPDSATIAIARDDETSFGVLHCRFHEIWALRMGTWLGKGNDPRYTPSTTFETFPFPDGLTPDRPASEYASDHRAQRIAKAASRLDELRNGWLNPPDLVRTEPEVVKGYPDRILPIDEKAATILKKRTLTNLYNQRPAWLDNAHRDLDAAVAAAYGWEEDISDDDALARMFELNQSRSAK